MTSSRQGFFFGGGGVGVGGRGYSPLHSNRQVSRTQTRKLPVSSTATVLTKFSWLSACLQGGRSRFVTNTELKVFKQMGRG